VLSLPLLPLLLLMLLLVSPPIVLLLLSRLGSDSAACIIAWALCWPAVKVATLCKNLLPEAGDSPAGRP
jgi:hypothetical protein